MIWTITETLLTLSRWTELDILGKVTLMLVAGLAVSYLARRRPASARHLLLAATFGTTLALPLIVISAPELAIGIPVPRASSSAVSDIGAITSSAVVSSQWGNSTADQPQEARSWAMPSWKTVLRLVWMAGAMLLLLFLAVDIRRLRRLRRSGIPAPELRARMHELAAECGIHRPVELLLHEDIPAPLTCGISRPAILLPDDARTWTEDDLRRALIHELEHVRRADWAVQLLARAACACYWFHPLVWVAWRRLSLEAERACDDAVVQGEESTDYAEQLVSLARRLSKGPLQPALGMAHRSDLSTRVTAVLDASQTRGRASLLAAAATFGVASLVVTAIGPMRAVAQSAAIRAAASDAALFEAAERGDISGIERLLSLGANVNARLGGDGSPLIAAARNGHDAAVYLLLDRGANPNMPVSGDGSPLIMAARNGHLSTVRLLLGRGADIHMPVSGDGNPLIMAARGGDMEVVEFLLDRGANIEQVVPGDENALIEASASGHLPVVKFLAGRGANVNARVWVERNGNREGEWRTPLNMARKRGHGAVVAFLQSAGARE
ncbi:MAG: M56 family metallopeptidase [Bryobacteraceae bacterium]